MRAPPPRVARLVILMGFAAGLPPAQAVSQTGSLKDIQRSVRERMLTEGGASDLVYTKIDFSHCAATVASRTLKEPGSREVRVTTSFHLASLSTGLAEVEGGPPYVVRVQAEDGALAFRQIRQAIDSGAVRETLTMLPALELRFLRRATADVVRAGFARLVTICRSDDPLLRAPGPR